MVKVYLWDDYLGTHDDLSKIEHIYEVDEEIYDLMGTPLQLGNDTYAICSITRDKGYVTVTKLNMLHSDEVICTDEITCPECNQSMSDSWECDDNDDHVCGYCGTEYCHERNISVDYSTTVINVGNNIKVLI